MRSVGYRYEFSEWSSIIGLASRVFREGSSLLVYRVFREGSSLIGLESGTFSSSYRIKVSVWRIVE